MRNTRSTGLEWERVAKEGAARAVEELRQKQAASQLARAQRKGPHPSLYYLLPEAPAMHSAWSLLKRAADVMVVVRVIISFLGLTTVQYFCYQKGFAAQVAIEYSRRSGKKKQQKTVVAHEPRLEPVQTVRFTPKANVQLVPALSRLHITKHFNTEYRGDCQISVTRQIAGGPTYDRQEMLISLPKSFEAEAVYRGALVHYRYEDTVVIRVERDRALDKAIQRYFEIPEEVAYQLDAACVELIQSFLVGKKA